MYPSSFQRRRRRDVEGQPCLRFGERCLGAAAACNPNGRASPATTTTVRARNRKPTVRVKASPCPLRYRCSCRNRVFAQPLGAMGVAVANLASSGRAASCADSVETGAPARATRRI
ncbi:hypothetical protein HPB50_009288 [Hyalomma asiaticum]|uniref:Uncharacterized protein n=1 Tax=Hyalomma asiaticum TaxID=266040 RepID=A0ACB7THV7_HYAAI|nr:hypothetical protein HPB50_009288 [Hyalomma asiaticum]